MCQLLETIKLENGELYNMKFHNLRFNIARKEVFRTSKKLDLTRLISIPEDCKTGLFRCRVTYSEEIKKVEFIPHTTRKIKSLKVVECNDIEYPYKYANRQQLSALFAQRGDCDEIIIVKNGFVSDCSIGNLVFFDGEKWWTPSTPLLNGTQRMKLLSENIILEKEIKRCEIPTFEKTGIINVFYNWGNMPVIPIANIQY